MSTFMELAKAVSQAQAVDTTSKISSLKERKSSLTHMMDIAIAQEELKKNEQDAEKNRLKEQEKKAKIKADLLKSVISDQAGPVAIGGNLVGQFAPQVEPDAADLPMIDLNSRQV